jgi:hypothetical protein
MCKTPLELVQTYLCGSMKMISMGGAWFFMTFTNNNTKTWCMNLLLKQKSKALVVFKKFQAMFDNNLGKKIEFMS